MIYVHTATLVLNSNIANVQRSIQNNIETNIICNMDDIYDRIIVKGYQIATGPDLPGPDFSSYFFSTPSKVKSNFIFYMNEWYKIWINLSTIIDTLILGGNDEYYKNVFSAWITLGSITNIDYPLE